MKSTENSFKFHLRQVVLPDDYSAISRLINLLNQELNRPLVSPNILQHEDSHIPVASNTGRDKNGLLTGFCRERVLITDESGCGVGYGAAWRAPWTEPGLICSTIVVDADFRQRGIGGRLLKHLESWATEQGARHIVTEAPDHLAESSEFSQRNGFHTIRHMWQSTLQLQMIDFSQFDEVVHQLMLEGITFCSWKHLKTNVDEQILYELFTSTVQDNPGGDDISDFSEWMNGIEKYPELTFFALDGKIPVGMTIVTDRNESSELYNEFTGVARSHRGRHIASALKVLSLHTASRMGATVVRTDNDSLNVPMLSVNQKLGFCPSVGGHFVVEKRL